MDKEKTAMQQLIEKLKAYRNAEPEKHLNGSGLNFAINEATELLELEKKQIVEAYDSDKHDLCGCGDCGFCNDIDDSKPINDKTYYTTKYNQPQ